MSLDQRRIYEKTRFNELKQIKESLINASDGTVALYAINALWIEKWKNFLRYKN